MVVLIFEISHLPLRSAATVILTTLWKYIYTYIIANKKTKQKQHFKFL